MIYVSLSFFIVVVFIVVVFIVVFLTTIVSITIFLSSSSYCHLFNCHTGGWDGDKAILHSRFWGGSSKNEILTAPYPGPWKKINSDCSATDGSENIWEYLSIDVDSQGKHFDRFAVFIGYPQRSTKGELFVAGVSVKQIVEEFEVYCDFDTAEGPWTVFQKR